MNYIVFDLEWNMVDRSNPEPEVIEIGAVKVSETPEGLTVRDRFHIYVRPVVRAITARTRAFTGIRVPESLFHMEFPEALASFVRWVGGPPFALCSWGTDDLRVFHQNCDLHHLDSAWMGDHVDLQRLVMRLMESKQQVGLQRALEWMNMGHIGHHHRAMDDAENAAQLLLAIQDKVTIERQPWKRSIGLDVDSRTSPHVARITAERNRLGVSQKTLAARAGLSVRDLRSLERGRLEATDEHLTALQGALEALRGERRPSTLRRRRPERETT